MCGMGVHVPQGEGAVSGLCPHWPIGFNGVFLRQTYSTRTSKVDGIFVRIIYRCDLGFVGFPKIQSGSSSMLGLARNLQKCNS